MNRKFYFPVLATVLVLSQANIAAAATFSKSFSGVFEDFLVEDVAVDSGSISYTLEAEDLDGDGELTLEDLDSEVDFLLLEANGFSTPEFNFSVSFARGDNPDIFFTMVPDTAPLFFDFQSEQIFASFDADVGAIVVDELGFAAASGAFPGVSGPIASISVDLDNTPNIAGEVIFTRISESAPIPEPSPIIGSLMALGLGVVIKRRKY